MARCIGCPKDLKPRKDGTLRDHERDVWLGGPNYRREPCPGSGHAPRDATAPAPRPAAPSTARPAAPPPASPGRVEGSAPRGAFEAQRRAYAAVGLTWSPQAIREQVARRRRRQS